MTIFAGNQKSEKINGFNDLVRLAGFIKIIKNEIKKIPFKKLERDFLFSENF